MVEFLFSSILPSDLLTVFGVAEKPGKKEPWQIEIKAESKRYRDPKPPQLKVTVDHKRDTLPSKSKIIERLQLKRERDQPDSTQHVRLKKFNELAVNNGVAVGATSFFTTQEVPLDL